MRKGLIAILVFIPLLGSGEQRTYHAHPRVHAWAFAPWNPPRLDSWRPMMQGKERDGLDDLGASAERCWSEWGRS